MVCRLRRGAGSVTPTTSHTRASGPVAGSAPNAPKEVARVINSTLTMTAQRPSFGMPTYGPTLGARVAVPASAVASVSTCARIRHIGGLGLAAKGDFPGTRAWRPPSC